MPPSDPAPVLCVPSSGSAPVLCMPSSGSAPVPRHQYTRILQVALFPFAVVAVIVQVPLLTAFTFPEDVTVAIPVLLLLHVTLLLVALAGATVALSVYVLPFLIQTLPFERVTFVGAMDLVENL